MTRDEYAIYLRGGDASLAGRSERPARLDSPTSGWVWAARRSTPVWQEIPHGKSDQLIERAREADLDEPFFASVEYVDGSVFFPVSRSFIEAIDALRLIEEPEVIMVDHRGDVLAITQDEYVTLLIRGHVDDWPSTW